MEEEELTTKRSVVKNGLHLFVMRCLTPELNEEEIVHHHLFIAKKEVQVQKVNRKKVMQVISSNVAKVEVLH